MEKIKNMKKFGIILIIFFIIMAIFNTSSFATHTTNGKYLGLYNKGNGRPTGFYTSGTTKGSKQNIPIIKIVEYTSQTGSTDVSKQNQAIYCLKDGVGFGAEGSQEIEHYTEYFDLKNPSSIDQAYRSVLPSDSRYNQLMWLLDNICIPEDEQSVQNLLDKADATDFKTYITNSQEQKDILEVIQQAAIWYITNAGDEYQPSKHETFHVATGNGVTSTSIGSKYQMEEVDGPIANIYEYLIDGAESNSSYDYTSTAGGDALSFEKNKATVDFANGYVLVGPYKLSGSNYTNLNVKILNGQSEISTATIVDSNKAEVQGSSTTEKIKSIMGQEFYIRFPANTSVSQVKVQVSAEREEKTLTYWSAPTNSKSQPVVIVENKMIPSNFEDTKNITKPNFDLALRKFITEIDGKQVTPSREPQITQQYLQALATGDSSALDSGTTSKKTHTKNARPVSVGSKIRYTIRVYNEGEIDGYAEEITDYLPNGLELVPQSESSINAMYRWTEDENNKKVIKSDYLSKTQNETANLIKAFDKNPANGQYTLYYKDIEVECRVVATVGTTDTHLKNVAEITKTYNDENVQDRDSTPNDLTESQKNSYSPGTSTEGKGYEDDDDYEDLVLQGKYFDLALRKFITGVNDTELKTNGVYDREPKVDVTPLLNGETTASYKHVKSPVSVSAGDIVTYTLRIYNEGQVDGYADEIVDHLPPELEFLPEDEINQKYLWTIDSSDRTQRTIRTTYLSKEHDEDNVIKAFDPTSDSLDYKEIQIRCKVVLTAPTLKKITNIAEITISSNNENLTDRDNEKNVTLPQDSDLPDYKGNEENKDDLSDENYHYKGQEDDDDFEKVILEKFDLALRKFITGVNDEQVNTRIPTVDTSKYGTIVDGKEITDMEYKHSKDPVRVANNDVVTYTIRVYNEGTKDGYAAEIKDDIPDGLEFLPENETNQKYKWVMYDKDGNVTTNVKNAVTIATNYLSRENEETEGMYLLKAFDPETMDTPDYKDVKIAFRVIEPNTSDRIITNQAQISKDTDKDGEDVDDIDSTPDQWNEGEDDQDVEHLYVKYFDLALRKWVSQAILIEDGIQKEMDTDHYAEQDPEPVVKVELNKDRIENTIIKFRYQIRITNEGEIEGYATEISDYIPDGLKFNQADNPKWREENGKIVTDQLKDTLLKPGESATIEVLLTWINGEDNLNLKVNVAEISEDENPSDSPDIDSTPNNKKDGEDDIDDAPVVLTVVTGIAQTYIAIIAGAVLILAAGALVIKKYVI